MKNFKILVDTNSDLTKELRQKYDIEYLKSHITFPDGKEMEATLEWGDLDPKAFFTSLKNKKNVYTTAPASPEEYKNKFLEFVNQGFDVLSISISSALSGTFDFACQGMKLAKDEAPDAKIYCIDSKKYSTGFGLLAILASIKRSEGLSIDEVYKYVTDNCLNIHQMGYLDDLSFVASKGRISHPAAFFGQLIGIKPLADFDPNGKVTVIGKTKGEKSAFNAIISYIKETIINPTEQIILIAETIRKENAIRLKELIESEIKPKEVIITSVFPSCGINVGPGLCAAYYFGKKTSIDLKEETELMQKILNA